MLLSRKIIVILLGLSLVHGTVHSAEAVVLPPPPGEGPALPNNLIDQADIEIGIHSLKEIRKAGGLVFTTPFNRFDGLGDGPPDIFDNTASFPFRGDRATLQTKNTTMLRINGLDAQTCQECHSIVSRAVVPFTLGIGGHGGINTSPMPGTQVLDAAANIGVFEGVTQTTGRVINPPFMYGAGGVELLAKEMTRDLQAILAAAKVAASGAIFDLITKGVYFGTITSNGGGSVTKVIDNDLGIDEDLVVRPFGRKGENFTVRDFDRGAMAFHMGIQANEIFPNNIPIDLDGDGIVEELSVGEMSALSVFLTTTPRPVRRRPKGDAKAGRALFNSIGCSTCHIPVLRTESKFLTQSFPDIANDPDANVFMRINLAGGSAGFTRRPGGGLRVPLFADLKRHDMGPELAESAGGAMASFFTTARLWGIADSAPYLHDGRAATLTEAILAHGGEAQIDSDNFAALSDQEKIELLAFLRTLKVPNQADVDKLEAVIRK